MSHVFVLTLIFQTLLHDIHIPGAVIVISTSVKELGTNSRRRTLLEYSYLLRRYLESHRSFRSPIGRWWKSERDLLSYQHPQLGSLTTPINITNLTPSKYPQTQSQPGSRTLPSHELRSPVPLSHLHRVRSRTYADWAEEGGISTAQPRTKPLF